MICTIFVLDKIISKYQSLQLAMKSNHISRPEILKILATMHFVKQTPENSETVVIRYVLKSLEETGYLPIGIPDNLVDPF